MKLAARVLPWFQGQSQRLPLQDWKRRAVYLLDETTALYRFIASHHEIVTGEARKEQGATVMKSRTLMIVLGCTILLVALFAEVRPV